MKDAAIKVLYILISAALILAIGGCSENKGTMVARVGDRVINIEDINNFFERAGFRFESADKELQARRDVLDTLINQQLLIIGAYDYHLENNDEVRRVLEGEKHKFLLDVLFEKKIISKATPSEAEMKDWYVRTGEEVRASHILTATKEDAEKVLKELKDGAAFEELAVKYSTDPSAARNQGDLGWFTWGSMVDNFQEAAFSMKPGEISQPIKTEFGWHIINLVDRRKIEDRPPYEEMKPYIRSQMIDLNRRKLMRQYAELLRKEYPVTVEENTCKFVLEKLQFLYPDSIGGRPRWRNNIDIKQLDPSEQELVLGRWEGGEMTLGDYLNNLRRVREDFRPDFDQYDSLAYTMFQMEFMDILVAEAKKMGLEDDQSYLNKLKQFKELTMADVMRNDTIPYKANVNEGEIRDYYDNHLDEFMTPLRFRVLEIQLNDKDKAEQYANSIKSEARFRTIASRETIRPGMKKVSGDLGIVTGQLYPQIYEAAREMHDGEISDVIDTGIDRWSVIWIKERMEPIQEEFSKVQQKILDELTQNKGDFLYKNWIDSMKNIYPIEIKEDVLKNSVDQSKYIAKDTIPTEDS